MRYDSEGNFAPMSDREAVHSAWKWGVFALLALILIPLVIWLVSAAFAPTTAKINERRQVNTATNRIFQKNHFFDLWSDVKSQTAQIKIDQQAADAHRSSTAGQQDPIGAIASEQARLDAVVQGVKGQCMSNLNQYNVDVQKDTGGQFRQEQSPEHLPTGLDDNCGQGA